MTLLRFIALSEQVFIPRSGDRSRNDGNEPLRSQGMRRVLIPSIEKQKIISLQISHRERWRFSRLLRSFG